MSGNTYFRNFRVCGAIHPSGGVFTYAIPNHEYALINVLTGWLLKRRGYAEIYSVIMGRMWRKPVTRIGKLK